jgi:hypothetical protein
MVKLYHTIYLLNDTSSSVFHSVHCYHLGQENMRYHSLVSLTWLVISLGVMYLAAPKLNMATRSLVNKFL